MAEDTNKSVRFIAKLLELTQDNRLSWKIGPEGTYSAKLEDKLLKIYETRRKIMPDPVPKGVISWSRSPVIKNVIVLELLNSDETRAFKFEAIAGMRDLLQAVSFSASKVDEFIDKVLSK